MERVFIMSRRKNTSRQNRNINFAKLTPKNIIKAKTLGQSNYIKSIIDNEVVFCVGPAGTGKSAIAVGMAAYSLCKGDYDKIILTRPIVSAGTRKLGALPGDLKEKITPYLVPVVEELRHFLGEELFYKFSIEGKIIAEPLELMRGRNFHNSIMILDEAQNCEYEDIVMFVTRMGDGSRICINGDTDQCDLNYRDDYSPLEDIINRVSNLEKFGIVRLSEDDIVRNPLIKSFLKSVSHKRKRNK